MANTRPKKSTTLPSDVVYTNDVQAITNKTQVHVADGNGSVNIVGNAIEITGTSPTVYFSDSDNTWQPVLHANGDLLYVIRRRRTTSAWETLTNAESGGVDGEWPLYINMANGVIVAPGSIYGKTEASNIADRRLASTEYVQNAFGAYGSGAGVYGKNMMVFTTSQNWTPPAGKYYIEVIGAGGNGGVAGLNGAAGVGGAIGQPGGGGGGGGGGGSGGYSAGWFSLSNQLYSVTVGAAGSTTSFHTIVSATSGAVGGTGANGTSGNSGGKPGIGGGGGAGGIGVGGAINRIGAQGSAGGPGVTPFTGAGITGSPGAGGSLYLSVGGSGNSGAGQSGIVIVRW